MISVVMIIHNRENFVKNIIEDILGQTFIDFEYIIVDNYSTDQSGTIAEEYAKVDSRIHVIHLGKECSIGKARNKGVSHSKGEFVAFVDDDDRVEKDYLETLNQLILLDTKIDCAICGVAESINGEISPQCVFEGSYIYSATEAVRELLKREKIRSGTAAKLIRRSIIKKYPFHEECRHEDIHNTYKYLSEVRKAAICGEPKYLAVRHGGNVSFFTSDSSKITPGQLEEYLFAFQERTRFLSEKLPDLAEYVQYCEWSYMISMCRKIVENKLDLCDKQLERMRNELLKNKEAFFSMEYIKDFEKKWMEKYVNA